MWSSQNERGRNVAKKVVYGLIPARGGSTGLPGKNLRSFHGHPLISYIVTAALGSRVLHRVIVSTDSEEIADVVQKYGAEVIIHPAKLSTTTASTFGVVKNAIAEFRKGGCFPDVTVLMRPTSPLCGSEDIDRAVRKLMRHPKADSVISVVKSNIHPYRVLSINRQGELVHFHKDTTEKDYPQRRQTFKTVYIRNGAIYATRTKTIEKGSLWGKHSLPYEMPRERSININDEIDFRLAEVLMN
jgi:CMP-N,N'-diacetyllegionaminic acid synthase